MAKTTLVVLMEAVAGYPAMAAAAPGSVISANSIIHPIMFRLSLPPYLNANKWPTPNEVFSMSRQMQGARSGNF